MTQKMRKHKTLQNSLDKPITSIKKGFSSVFGKFQESVSKMTKTLKMGAVNTKKSKGKSKTKGKGKSKSKNNGTKTRKH